MFLRAFLRDSILFLAGPWWCEPVRGWCQTLISGACINHAGLGTMFRFFPLTKLKGKEIEVI